MQNGLDIEWNNLNHVPCEALRGDAARQKAQELGLDILEELQQAIKMANNDFALTTNLHPSRAIARWGKICQDASHLLSPRGWAQVRQNGQPCIKSPDGKIQIIFISPNQAFGNSQEIITASYPKGIATELKLLANKSHYSAHEFVRTFIVYYQPCNQIDATDEDWIPFEIAYAIGIYRVKSSKENPKCLPFNHTLRLIFTDPSNGMEPYKAPLPDHGNDITEDDFGNLIAI